MKKKYILEDGGEITATSTSDFITKLKESSKFDSEKTNSDFMIAFSDRYFDYSGNRVRTENEDLFMFDLFEYKYIQRVQPA